MTGACVLLAGRWVALGAASFTLSWTHSVEKTGWQERWAVRDGGLVIEQARVQGSGAGMEPGEGAVRDGSWWVWRPEPSVVPELLLAASGDTISGWRVCRDGGQACLDLGRQASDPVRIAPCRGRSE